MAGAMELGPAVASFQKSYLSFGHSEDWQHYYQQDILANSGDDTDLVLFLGNSGFDNESHRQKKVYKIRCPFPCMDSLLLSTVDNMGN